MRTAFGCIVVVTAAVLFPATAADEKPKLEKLTGTIEFPADTKFDEGTTAVVAIQDTSLADAPAKTIATQTIKDLKKMPVEFAVEFDPAQINPKATITLSVRVSVKDKLAFINDTSIPVINGKGATKDVKAKVIAVKR